jgi:nucleoside-diphosphate-sugar epimerase
MKKILVTGNMGYIGPSVIKRLAESYPGSEIIGLDTGFFANCLTNCDTLPECGVAAQYFQDVRGFSDNLLDGVDSIVHLAAISNDPIGNTFEDVTYEVNYLASVKIAKAARDKGVKNFVYASSCSMYGFAEDGARNEDSPLNPLTAYARSKVYSEKDLQNLARDDFRITSLRFSTACGMSERLRLDLVLNDFVASAVATGKITILSDGTPWRPLINIKDMARAIDWAAGRDNGTPFLAVNVGANNWNYKVLELAEAVAHEIPGTTVEINRNAMPDKRSYKVSFDLFSSLVPEKYQLKMDLEGTIRELKEGLIAMGFADGNFRNSRYMRLMVLKDLRARGLLNEKLEWTRARYI